MKPKELKFAKEVQFFDGFFPIKKHIPQWYKDAEAFGYKNIQFDENQKVKANFKNCMPFFDSLNVGYCLETQFDILVSGPRNEKYLYWTDGSIKIVITRSPDQNPTFPVPVGYSNQHFAWNFLYNMQLPEGHSAIISHPFNRFDLPFVTLTGIVDADSPMSDGFIPFFIKNDFEGLIPAGTPFLQVIPFKRDNWKAVEDNKIIKHSKYLKFKSQAKAFGFYKKNSWRKKVFE